MTVRVRFAPSPTGYLHIGSARTALFNWMFAKRHQGTFILRIEDTDQKRLVKGAISNILDDLRWLGMNWDEGPDIGGPHAPYIQSERADLYRHWAHWLLAGGTAYKCFCAQQDWKAKRATTKSVEPPVECQCLKLSASKIALMEAEGQQYAIRLNVSKEGSTIIKDVIRGDIVIPNKQISNAVLLKSDGLPTYHLANVIDDHFMGITHILRADEWISTAPLHIHLYRAFGWEMPIYAHLSLILNPNGKGKLSKRAQAFQADNMDIFIKVAEFREAGFLPEAVVNFLANVGWAYGDDQEIFNIEDAIQRFELKDINPAPARLPYAKLDWVNGQYLQKMEVLPLAQALKPLVDNAGIEISSEALALIVPALQPRLKRLNDAFEFLRFLDDDAGEPLTADQLTHKYLPAVAAQAAFADSLVLLQTADPFTVDVLSEGLRQIGEKHVTNAKAGPLLGTLRLALTQQKVSPPLFESIVALGRERAMARLVAAAAIVATAVTD